MTFNRLTVLKLKEEVRDGFISIIELYLERLPNLIESMDQAIRLQDAKTLERAAHSLKGSSRHLGLETVVGLAETIENLAHAKQVDHELQSLFDNLKGAIPYAQQEMTNILVEAKTEQMTQPSADSK